MDFIDKHYGCAVNLFSFHFQRLEKQYLEKNNLISLNLQMCSAYILFFMLFNDRSQMIGHKG